MSKLYFKFGAMASSKTANALMTRFNYEEKGNRVWLIKPDLDNRDDYVDENGKKVTVVKSRIGLSAVADVIRQDEDLLARFKAMNKEAPVDVIICDECQFLTEKQIDQLRNIVNEHNIPVLCFGLRTDFQTRLFPGSRRLMELADCIEEIKTMCDCGAKATINARIDGEGYIVTQGAQVVLGGNDSYIAMCHRCWMQGIREHRKIKLHGQTQE